MLLQLILSQRTLRLSSFLFILFLHSALQQYFHHSIFQLIYPFFCSVYLLLISFSVFFISVIALFIRDYSEIWSSFYYTTLNSFSGVDCLFPSLSFTWSSWFFPSSFICNIFSVFSICLTLTVLAISFLMAVGSQFLLLLVSVLQWVRMVQELV